MFFKYERMSAGHEPPTINRSKVKTRGQNTASLQLAVTNVSSYSSLPVWSVTYILRGVVQFAAVFLSDLSRVRFSVWT